MKKLYKKEDGSLTFFSKTVIVTAISVGIGSFFTQFIMNCHSRVKSEEVVENIKTFVAQHDVKREEVVNRINSQIKANADAIAAHAAELQKISDRVPTDRQWFQEEFEHVREVIEIKTKSLENRLDRLERNGILYDPDKPTAYNVR